MPSLKLSAIASLYFQRNIENEIQQIWKAWPKQVNLN